MKLNSMKLCNLTLESKRRRNKRSQISDWLLKPFNIRANRNANLKIKINSKL